MSEELKSTDGVIVLPDGSAFATASFPLPKDHWLYAPRGDWDSVRDEFAETPLPILTNAQRDAVIAAGRYAVRGATMCGKEADFDPDALVQNLCYALCGPANAPMLLCDAPQLEPAAPETFMGEPVLTRWKPLNRDDSRLALHQSMHNRSFGNPSDDKLMLEWLWENGYALCKRVPDEAAPTPQQQALDRMVENAETLGLYEAAPTEATLDQMAGKAWDRFQRHTAELQALENCRLYAARHRKEDWAATILRFCADGGATGSPLREAAPTVVEPVAWAGYDLDGMVEAFHRVIEAHANKNNPFHNPIDADAQMALRILRGLVPAMKAYAPTPPRAALSDEQIEDALNKGLCDDSVFTLMTKRQVRLIARAIERAHGITADRGQG